MEHLPQVFARALLPIIPKLIRLAPVIFATSPPRIAALVERRWPLWLVQAHPASASRLCAAHRHAGFLYVTRFLPPSALRGRAAKEPACLK